MRTCASLYPRRCIEKFAQLLLSVSSYCYRLSSLVGYFFFNSLASRHHTLFSTTVDLLVVLRTYDYLLWIPDFAPFHSWLGGDVLLLRKFVYMDCEYVHSSSVEILMNSYGCRLIWLVKKLGEKVAWSSQRRDILL